MKKLNIGCGNNYLHDYINIDQAGSFSEVRKVDITKSLPFKDSYFDFIYSSHVLEHLTQLQCINLLKDCYKKLRPGALMRIAIPDLQRFAEDYLEAINGISEGDDSFKLQHKWSTIDLIDQSARNHPGGIMVKKMIAALGENDKEEICFLKARYGYEFDQIQNDFFGKSSPRKPSFLSRLKKRFLRLFLDVETLDIGTFRQSGECHLWMYDMFSMTDLLKKLGFKNVSIQKFNTTSDQNFSLDVIKLDSLKNTERKPMSLYIECYK